MIYSDLLVCKDNQNRLCKNKELLNQALANTEVEIKIKSKFIDLSNINDPIKTYTDRLDMVSLHPEVFHRTDLFIDRNEITLDDSVLSPFVQPTTRKLNKV